MEFLSQLLDLQKLREFLTLVERFGWMPLAFIGVIWLSIKSGKAVSKGACFVWGRIEPFLTDILSSHSGLMKTTAEQMPKQTAILQRLSDGHDQLRSGQETHTELLASIRDTVNRFTPVRADGEQDNSQ